MITKEQALTLKYGDIVHYEGKGECRRMVGKRGGVKLLVVAYRVSGKLINRGLGWSIPIKRGLYENGTIWMQIEEVNGYGEAEMPNGNFDCFHLASECPLEVGRVRLTLP